MADTSLKTQVHWELSDGPVYLTVLNSTARVVLC